VALDFVARLRGQLKFDSSDELVVQMREDVEEARRLLA
jgi:riboflavin kinase/FMN adenylyltransferase